MSQKYVIENTLGLILLIGSLLAASIVLGGGIWYLMQHAPDKISFGTLQGENYALSFNQLLTVKIFSTPIGLIECGLYFLVATQILRVLLLVFFYIYEKDVIFTLISLFVTVVLIYSNLFNA